mmetsp:Transcript_4578/g.6565  ORF Transcript_4578/g.6565 Transcript_4578/m.6565 type:complete len:100 (+) Transcript_4578:18-317(+)
MGLNKRPHVLLARYRVLVEHGADFDVSYSNDSDEVLRFLSSSSNAAVSPPSAIITSQHISDSSKMVQNAFTKPKKQRLSSDYSIKRSKRTIIRKVMVDK